MERTDQESERDTNQHLLIASGVLGERLIYGQWKGRGEGGQKDNHHRQSSKNTKECHILCRLFTGHSREWVEMALGFDVQLCSVVVDSTWTLRHFFPKCMYQPICPAINHSTFVYVTHYFSQIQLKAVGWRDRRIITGCYCDEDLKENWLTVESILDQKVDLLKCLHGQ